MHADCVARIAGEACRRSFGTLFEFYGPRLKAYLRKLGASDGQAEEVVQDVMLTVWRKADQFDPSKASVSTWVFRIARNRHIDTFRKTVRPELSPDEPMLQPPRPDEPDDMVSQGQIEAHVREQLKTLPAEQLDLLKAAFYEGLSHSEIAETYGIPLGTVKSRIRLAFDKLRGTISRD